MVAAGQTVELWVDRVLLGGDGLAQLDGLKVFVPFSAPQERVRARLVTRKKDYAVAHIEEVIEPSPLRTRPACPHFGVCGGCQLQHIGYQGQLVSKKLIVNDALQRIGRVFLPVGNVQVESAEWHYRNKTQYPVGAGIRPRIGFYRRSSHDIVEVGKCLLHPPEFDDIRSRLCERLAELNMAGYDEATRRGTVRHVVLRQSVPSGRVSLIIVTSGRLPPDAKLARLGERCGVESVVVNFNPDRTNRILGSRSEVLAGPGSSSYTILGVTLRASAASFFQVNVPQAEEVCRKILRMADLQGDETVLDVYSGVGMISLVLAGRSRQVTGIELSSEAVADAEYNAAANSCRNVRFLRADATAGLGTIEAAQVVVLDPPRKGCEPALLKRVVDLKPRSIIYVSCNPATLARDLRIMQEMGYAASSIEPVDMFPQTFHVETVSLLQPT